MKLRICKKNLKKSMRESGLRIVATHGRTFVFAPKPNVLCRRWGHFIAVSQAHPSLAKLIAEGLDKEKLGKRI